MVHFFVTYPPAPLHPEYIEGREEGVYTSPVRRKRSCHVTSAFEKKKKNIVRSYGYFAITAAVSVHRYHQHFNVPLEKKKLKKNGETRERERERSVGSSDRKIAMRKAKAFARATRLGG